MRLLELVSCFFSFVNLRFLFMCSHYVEVFPFCTMTNIYLHFFFCTDISIHCWFFKCFFNSLRI